MSSEVPSTSELDIDCPQFESLSRERLRHLMNPVAAIRAATDEQHNIGTENDPYPDIFEFTHHPITVFESDSIGQSGQDESDPVPESAVYEALNTSESRNYAVVIQGSVGTGKSELCTYVIHRLEQDQRPVLEVRKDDDLMTLLTERIPDFYEAELGKDFPHRTDYEGIQQALENPERVGELATLMVVNALNDLRADYTISCSEEERSSLIEYVEDNIEVIRKVADEEEGRGSQIVESRRYEQKSFLQVFADESELEHPADRLNTALWEALLDKFDTQGLKEVFEFVAEEFDRRPVAVFEDFSIASVQAEELGEFIERDVHGDSWDFVLAGTMGSLRPLRTQTFLTRFSIFQTNKSDSNQVDFLDEDSVIDFVEPYLTYIKAQDDSITLSNSEDGSSSYQKEPPAPDSLCGNCPICPDDSHYLFPFNETFIRRIFNPGLSEDERSPRELVGIIRDILEVTFYGPTDVPSSADVLSNLHNEVTLHDDVYDRAEKFADLAKWYGVEGDEYAVVDRRFGDVFGLVNPADKQEDDLNGAGIELNSDEIRIPLADTDPSRGTQKSEPRKKKEDTEEGGEEGEKEGDKEDTTEDLIDRRYDELKSDLDNWRNDPRDEAYEELNSLVSDAFTDQIKRLTGNFRVWQDSSLKYNLSRSKRPFVYANPGEAVSEDVIELDPKEFRRSTLREILRYGLESEHSSVNEGSYFRDHGTQITALADRWQTQIQDKYIHDDEILFDKRTSEYDFIDFIVASYSLCVLLDDPWIEVTPKTINDKFGESEDLTLDPTLEQGIKQGKMNEDQIETLTELVSYAGQFEDLLESRVALSRNRLDLVEVRRRMETASPFDVLDHLAKTRVNEVSTRVRFSPDATLRDLAHAARKTTENLDNLESNSGQSDLPKTLSERFDNVDMEEVNNIIDSLKRSHDDLLQPDFRDHLDILSEFDQEKIKAVQRGIDHASKTAFDKNSRIQQTLALTKLEADQLVSLVDELYETKAARTEDFAPEFSEVSEYYVE